jgi:hypothetical protein
MTFLSKALSRYSIKNPDQVYGFIGTDARLLGLLQESYDVISGCFGAASLSLEFHEDMEYRSFDALWIGIPTLDGSCEVLRKERDFDEQFLFNFPAELTRRVMLDFIFIEANT